MEQQCSLLQTSMWIKARLSLNTWRMTYILQRILHRDLCCHSAMKTNCVISADFSDVRKALCTKFEWALYFDLQYMLRGTKKKIPFCRSFHSLVSVRKSKFNCDGNFQEIVIYFTMYQLILNLNCEVIAGPKFVVFLRFVIIHCNFSKSFAVYAKRWWFVWLVSLSCRSLIVVVSMLLIWNHFAMASRELTSLLAVDGKLLLSWEEAVETHRQNMFHNFI